MTSIKDVLMEKMGIRSPSLEMQGYYHCENCKYHDDLVFIGRDDGETVVCMMHGEHVNKHHTCRDFKRGN